MTQVARTIAELRILVGYLGELAPSWWPSQFFSPAAAAFLAPVFTRTLLQAQCQGVTAAAARLHDEHIGVGRILHLFRMPQGIEQAIATVLAASGFAEEVRPHFADRESALTRLKALASDEIALEGPVALGALSEDPNQQLKTIAGLYYDAFNKGSKSFPYFREA